MLGMLGMLFAFAVTGFSQSATELYIQKGAKAQPTVNAAAMPLGAHVLPQYVGTGNPEKDLATFHAATAKYKKEMGIVETPAPVVKSDAPTLANTGNPEKDMADYNAAKAAYKKAKGLTDPASPYAAQGPHQMTQAEFDALRPEKKEYVLKHASEFKIVNNKN